MSVYVSPQSSYSRGRGIRASEVAREMLESPNMGRCIEDLLPRMHIIEDRNDAKTEEIAGVSSIKHYIITRKNQFVFGVTVTHCHTLSPTVTHCKTLLPTVKHCYSV